jgi:phospholipase C
MHPGTSSHRFYQEQYQLDGGRMDRYTTGSDAVGLTQATTTRDHARSTSIILQRPGSRRGTSSRNHFFQAAFGGSFLKTISS